MPIEGKFYTSKELQEILNVSRQRISNLAKDNDWVVLVPGLYRAEDVENYLAKRYERSKKMAKDWVYCSECGESYNRLGPGHKCDPKALAAIAREEEADQEVREREEDEEKG
jgi:hypothetical protein